MNSLTYQEDKRLPEKSILSTEYVDTAPEPTSVLSSSSSSSSFLEAYSYRIEIDSVPETYHLLLQVFSVGIVEIVLSYAHQVLPMFRRCRDGDGLDPSERLTTTLSLLGGGGSSGDCTIKKCEMVTCAMMSSMMSWFAHDGELAHAVNSIGDATTIDEWKNAVLHCESIAIRLWASTQTAQGSVDRSDSLSTTIRKRLLLKRIPKMWRERAALKTECDSMWPPLHMECFAVALSRLVAANEIYTSGLVYARRVKEFWTEATQWISYIPHIPTHTQCAAPLEIVTHLGIRNSALSFWKVCVGSAYVRHFKSVEARCAYALVVCTQGNYGGEGLIGIPRNQGIALLLALNTKLVSPEESVSIKDHTFQRVQHILTVASSLASATIL